MASSCWPLMTPSVANAASISLAPACITITPLQQEAQIGQLGTRLGRAGPGGLFASLGSQQSFQSAPWLSPVSQSAGQQQRQEKKRPRHTQSLPTQTQKGQEKNRPEAGGRRASRTASHTA